VIDSTLYVNFFKNSAVLKIQKNACPKEKLKCGNCTYTSKTEKDLRKHKQKYNLTISQINYKLFALTEIWLMRTYGKS
jgi:hypothetical protein